MSAYDSPYNLSLKQSLGKQTRVRLKVLILGSVLLLFFILWRWTPLSSWLDPVLLAGWIGGLDNSFLELIVVIVGFLLGATLVFPITLLIVATAVLFGPLLGFVYAMLGVLASAALTYGLGHKLGHAMVQRLAESNLDRLSRQLGRRGVITMAAACMLPFPYTVVNMTAGASHIRFRDFMLGITLGMTPWVLGLTLFADSAYSAILNPQPVNIVWLILALVLLAGVTWGFRRWLNRQGGINR